MNIFKSVIVWIVCLVVLIFSFPVISAFWLAALPFDKERRVMHRMMIYLAVTLSYLVPIWKLDIRGRKKAVKGDTYVIISNHQSILDILLINCLRYRFKWVSKIENLKTPFIGLYLKMADYITVDRGNRDSKDEMMEQCSEYLKKGISIMMFPEGTRSVDGEIGFFKRGAFQLAISTQKPVLPVLIDGSGGVLPKHGMIFNTGHKIKIRVFDPVQPESFNTDDPDTLSLKFHNFMVDALKELRSGL
jgi:1-acyl-sn-glycerol-3-phosphate acyltransferase